MVVRIKRMKQMKNDHEKYGNLLYSFSKKKSDLLWMVYLIAGLILVFLVAGTLIVKITIMGVFGAILFIALLIAFISGIRSYRYSYIQVYENGIWFPYPTFWAWQKKPPKHRYFRSFEDIIDIRFKEGGQFHLYIETESEGEIHFTVYRQEGPELREAIEKAMSKYEKNKN